MSVNTSDKPSKLKVRFVSRDLVPSDRATCTIASRVNFFDSKNTPSRRLRSLKFASLQNIYIYSPVYNHFHDILIRRIGWAPWQSDSPRVDSSTTCETITVHKLPLRFSTRSYPDSHTNPSVLPVPLHLNQITRRSGCWIPREQHTAPKLHSLTFRVSSQSWPNTSTSINVPGN